MRASLIIEAIKFQFNHNRSKTFAIEGQPGLGKSSVTYQAGKELGIPVVEFRPCNHGIEDLIGLPKFNKDGTSSFAKPDWLPNEERDGKEGIFFIDELAQAPVAMQNALSSLIHEPRQLHDYKLPDGWLVVTAFNSAKHRAATHKLPTHISDRLSPRIEMEFSLEDFVDYCAKNNIEPVIAAFAKWSEKALNSFDPKQDINCTPRSLCSINAFVNAPLDLQTEQVHGTIGEGVGSEFLGFLKIWKGLPDLDYLMQHPDKVQVPSEPNVLFALTQALSYRCTAQNADDLVKFVKRIPNEYQVMFFKETIKRQRDVAQSQAFKDFLSANRELII